MENLWREFEKKGDIFSYLKYKETEIFDLKVSDVNGNGKNSRNSDKNI